MRRILAKLASKVRPKKAYKYNCDGSFLIAGDDTRSLVFTRESKAVWLEIYDTLRDTEPGHLCDKIKLRQRDVSDLIKYLQGGNTR